MFELLCLIEGRWCVGFADMTRAEALSELTWCKARDAAGSYRIRIQKRD